jgi:fructan beta-fructosidase
MPLMGLDFRPRLGGMRRRTVLGGGLALVGALATSGLDGRPAWAATVAAGYYDEPYRPQFHFSAESNWLNDPNGLIYYEGEYHLFYQKNPLGITSGSMHWGHAVSRDLVSWTHLPIALYPDALGDIWSGSAVLDSTNTSGFFTDTGGYGLVAIFTHADHPQQQSIAYSSDRGRTWTKYAGNPVIANPGVADFRDPKVFWYAPTGRWVMIVAGGQVRIYTSADLIHWTLESTSSITTECPDLFPLAVDGGSTTKWVLSMGGAQYHLGSFDGHAFTSEIGPLAVDAGPDFYAAQSYGDLPDGRRIWLAWMRGDVNSPQTTFMGRMTIPRELSLQTLPAGVRLVQKPLTELAGNRTGTVIWAGSTVSPGTNLLAGITGDSYEIQAEFQATGAAATEFGLRVRTGLNGSQYTIIGYDRVNQQIFVDKNVGGGGYVGHHVAAMAPDSTGKIRLHAYVDRSSIEVFGNDGIVTFTELNYPDPASQGMEVYAVGGTVTATSVRLDRMRRTWGVSPFATSLTGWSDVAGSWAGTQYGREGRYGSDAFSLSAVSGADFTYEGDLRVLGGYAAALVFRSNASAGTCYVANVDVGYQGIKLFKFVDGTATVLGWTGMTLGLNTTYHLKVVTAGASIKVYLGDTLIHDLTDSSASSGLFGLNIFNGTAAAQNVFVNGTPITRYEAGDVAGSFVRHASGRGRIDPDPVPYADCQWRLVPGLADPAGVSFASVNFPGEYLRHRDGEIWKDPNDGTALFRADATWFRRPGLSDVTLMSFESANYPGEFMAHNGSLLYRNPTLSVLADEQFRPHTD